LTGYERKRWGEEKKKAWRDPVLFRGQQLVARGKKVGEEGKIVEFLPLRRVFARRKRRRKRRRKKKRT